MRGFLKWLSRPTPAILCAGFGISLFAACIWMIGVIGARWFFVYAFGLPMPGIVPFLFPLELWSVFLMVGFFSAVGFYIGYLWDTKRNKGDDS